MLIGKQIFIMAAKNGGKLLQLHMNSALPI